ncbi:fused response regulator/phosphatase [Pseudoalteromonas tunicata]|uniref:Putative response regulator n=1 Tax=Pseudoalteromonas tunicata D2 TaxID=87626 RepID=A4CD27_9GAMM|nr:fused response regulator/phosphatase [Pseudoalteromonas tunicata]ATC93976.1 hypothetical protein PTUN_a1337 [Pseudoalteromonas tunicata]AXT29764.1 response regulator [Pseudoalteromonas tunicata]EAR27470.1 putative response regulator [Pseudoalteromonas tunicata D2]MDP4985153.1 fused response regulator/phosphatase [Pseudoalteromonas tunicata]
MRILVVDDQQLNRTLLTFMLKAEGYEVESVENGQLALDIIPDYQPDIILLDVLMPVLNGYEVAPKIKEMSQDVYLPIIFITALDDQNSLQRCLEVGGDDFLSKPFDKVILSAKIKAHSRTRELSKKAYQQNQLLEYHQNETEREHEIVEHIFANALQERLVVPDLIEYHMSPASMFNGDMFLVAPSPVGGIYVLLGDFTGHGLAAAIGALPTSKVFYSMAHKGLSVGDIAAELNSVLTQLLPEHMFCAATIIELSSSGRSFSAWLGGLPDSYVLAADGSVKRTLESQHMALGILDDHEFERDIVHFEVDNSDRILVFTDGIIEAADKNDEYFGEERLLAVIASSSDAGINDLVSAVKEFSGDIAQQDDLSLVLLSCRPSPLTKQSQRVYCDVPMHFSLQLDAELLRSTDPVLQLVNLVSGIEGASEHRSNLFLLLSEAFNNALDHGVLKLDSKIKDQDDGFCLFYEQRLNLLNNLSEGEIIIRVNYDPSTRSITFSVKDSGDGFLVHPSKSTKEGDDEHGRGVNLIAEIASSVEYNEVGNEITIIYCLDNN